MAKLLDKMYNRVIEGKLLELSEEDLSTLKSAGVLTREDGTSVYFLEDWNTEVLYKVKAGDFIYYANGGESYWGINLIVCIYNPADIQFINLRRLADDLKLSVYNAYIDEGSVSVDPENQVELMDNAKGARIWLLNSITNPVEYNEDMKIGDIIISADDAYSGFIHYINFVEGSLENLVVHGVEGNLPVEYYFESGSILEYYLSVGTKLYKHAVNYGSGTHVFISTTNLSFTEYSETDSNSLVGFRATDSSEHPTFLTIQYNGSAFKFTKVNVWNNNDSQYDSYSIVSDTVTPL